MFLETKNAYGLVYIRIESIESIIPADVRESESRTSRLSPGGSSITTVNGNQHYSLESPMDIFDSITKAFD